MRSKLTSESKIEPEVWKSRHCILYWLVFVILSLVVLVVRFKLVLTDCLCVVTDELVYDSVVIVHHCEVALVFIFFIYMFSDCVLSYPFDSIEFEISLSQVFLLTGTL